MLHFNKKHSLSIVYEKSEKQILNKIEIYNITRHRSNNGNWIT